MHWELGRNPGDGGDDWDDIERLWQEIQSALPTPAPTSWVSGDLLCSELVGPHEVDRAAAVPTPSVFAAGDDGMVRVAVAQPSRRQRRRR